MQSAPSLSAAVADRAKTMPAAAGQKDAASKPPVSAPATGGWGAAFLQANAAAASKATDAAKKEIEKSAPGLPSTSTAIRCTLHCWLRAPNSARPCGSHGLRCTHKLKQMLIGKVPKIQKAPLHRAGALSSAAPVFNFGFPPASSAPAAAAGGFAALTANTPGGLKAQSADSGGRVFKFGGVRAPEELSVAEVVREVGDTPSTKPVRRFRFGLPPGSPPSSPESTRQSPAVRCDPAVFHDAQ